jgi:transposase
VLAAGQQQRWSYRALAERFQVGESTVRLWLRQARTTGQATPKRSPGARPAIRDTGVDVLRKLVEDQNDATLAELATRYGTQTGVAVGLTAVWRACRRLGLKRKRRKPARR